MRLLCHRGVWHRPGERNTHAALCAGLDKGLGLETDIRDCDGELVISHDMPIRAASGDLDALLAHHAKCGGGPMLALNIKSDGLQHALKARLEAHGVHRYFVFDMSVPDTLGYARAGMPFAVRLSEYEPRGALFDAASHVWLDAFERPWYGVELITQLLAGGKQVAVVSPELHRREPAALWASLKTLEAHDGLFLCTDLVDAALETFHVHQD